VSCVWIFGVHSDVCLSGSVHFASLSFICYFSAHSLPACSATTHLFCSIVSSMPLWTSVMKFSLWSLHWCGKITKFVWLVVKCVKLLSIICTINHLIGFRRLLYIYVQFVSFSTCAYIHAHTINSGFLCSVKLLIMLSIVPLQCMLYCLHSTSLGCSVTLAQNSSTNSLQDAVYLLWPAFLCGMPQQPSDKAGCALGANPANIPVY